MARVAHRAGTYAAPGQPTGMGFLLYLLGAIVLISGLAWLATLCGVAQAYVGGGALAMLGIAGVASIANARARVQEPAQG